MNLLVPEHTLMGRRQAAAERTAWSSVKATIEPLDCRDGVPRWWEPLAESACNASVFLSPAWMQSWLDVYGNEFRGQWIRWMDGKDTVGGCLLVRRVVWKRCIPLRSMFLNATGEVDGRTPLAEFNDILHVAGHGETIAADFARLVRQASWDRLLLSGYAERSVPDRLVELLDVAHVDSDPRPAPYVDIAALPHQPFLSTLVGRPGNKIRRNVRLHEEAHGDISIDSASGLDQAMQYFDEMATLHNSRWRSKGQAGSFASPAVVAFHQRLIRRLWPEGSVDLVRVRAGATVIGYLYNFLAQDKVYFFQSGFAYQDDKLSPGLLTNCVAIEHYRRKGFREYDMLAGDALYKRSLANASRTLHWTVLYRDRLWIRAALAMRATMGRMNARRRPGAAHGTAPAGGHL